MILEPEKFYNKRNSRRARLSLVLPRIYNEFHTKKDKDCYFTHVFFNTAASYSAFYNAVKPIMARLGLRAPIRIKGNLYPRTKNRNT